MERELREPYAGQYKGKDWEKLVFVACVSFIQSIYFEHIE